MMHTIAILGAELVQQDGIVGVRVKDSLFKCSALRRDLPCFLLPCRALASQLQSHWKHTTAS